MNKQINKKHKFALIVAGLIASTSTVYAESEFGEFNADFRLRYEGVDQANSLKDADALTLRTLLNFKTKDFNGFSGMIELEDSRALIDDYNDTLGKNPDYSVVADPETTELDQLFIQYKQEGFSAKIGRQDINLDNHRFVGNVGWRQDKQTFDAFRFTAGEDKWKFDYSYINKRNRIFADEKDIDSSDHLINASYNTQYGKFTGYGYLLEQDDMINNALDTWGVRWTGGVEKFLLQAEFALQDYEMGTTEYSSEYMLLEAGYKFDQVTAKLGFEILGSDSGEYGFQTPLATLHKFNGWTDQFLSTPDVGLQDFYASFAGNLWGGKWLVAYHDFQSDDSNAQASNYGSEFDAQYTRKITKYVSGGLKYANYSAGDVATGKVDTDRIWLWLQAKF
ncbi:alginate export family protein [Thalassotalea sp. LPB0316]|uniref:alginate export family protein n=1 Tax=Thalassotalea sp. LPB0316 TaxID=2769490 RepID=UPI0018660A26|nr:alginate export family protein [Thalassotalea sp. LPB0316]QOL24873.1 alginate export family protein [Thalassotalea sp. LPB0316]